MIEFDELFPKRPESLLYNSSQQFRDEVDREDKIEREKASIKLQLDLTKRVQDLEATLKKQREIDRQDRAKEREADYIQRQSERHSDRWFAAKTLIIAALVGALVVKLIEYFFR